MSDLDEPVDPPPGWQRDHVELYLANPDQGHQWRGVPTLLLTTRGHSSGKPRRTPLIYGRDGDRYLVVASAGGAPEHPAWFKNISADPHVRIQVSDQLFPATARAAAPAEKPALWQTMTQIWPAYDEYQTKTDRPIPVVIIEPLEGN